MVGSHRSLVRASLTMAGTIMGAGIFGLPAVFVRLGFGRGSLLFWGIALIVCVTHLLYVHIHLQTKKNERLGGYAYQYLGPLGGRIASVTYPFQILGVNLIYLLLGGQFLAVIFSHFGIELNVLNWQALLWAVVSISVLCGVRFVMKIEVPGTWLLIGSMLLTALVLTSVPTAPLSYLLRTSVATSLFGIFLFSLFGLPVVGEVVDLVGKKAHVAFLAVGIGSLSAAALSYVFGMSLARVAVDVPGNAWALQALFPASWWWVIPVVGFLAIVTSYLTTAQDLFKSFQLDWGFRRERAWVLALFPPFILLFVAQTTFLALMDIIGSLFSAANALFVCLIFLALLRKQKERSWSLRFAPVAPIAVFGATILQKLFSLFH